MNSDNYYINCCNICTEKFTGTLRKCISCPNCSFEQCKDCVKKYFLTITQNPHCMNCKVEWKRDYLCEVLPKTFLQGEYKKHREDVLMDREKSYLIETIPYAEQDLQIRRLQKQIEKVSTKLEQTKDTFFREMKGLPPQEENFILDFIKNCPKCPNEECAGFVKGKNLCESCKKRYTVYSDLKTTKEIILQKLRDLQFLNFSEKETKKEFVRKCPVVNCKGYLDSSWKCGLCESYVCSDCLEIKGRDNIKEHKCNPDDVETAKLLKKDSKPCPKCSALIFKIDGCAQIWCTQCHTAFDFRTGEIETNIHNPHYYEYVRRTGGNLPRAEGDVRCGGLPDARIIDLVIKKIFRIDDKSVLLYKNNDIHYMSKFRRNATHIVLNYGRRNQNGGENDNINRNRDLRLKYLIKQINEEDWKQELQKREKKNDESISIRSITSVLDIASQELLNRFVRIETIEEFIEIVMEAEHLRLYLNQEFFRHSNIFSTNLVLYISDKYENTFHLNRTELQYKNLTNIYTSIDEQLEIFRNGLYDTFKPFTNFNKDVIKF